MIRVEHHESVDRPLSLVFAAGLDTATWPPLEQLSLEAREALLSRGTNIQATVSELGQRFGLECEVTEISTESRLTIEGGSDLAWMSLGLDFAPSDDEKRTEVDVLLQLELRSFILRRTLGKVAAIKAKGNIRDFAEGFKANVEKLPGDYLDLHIPTAS